MIRSHVGIVFSAATIAAAAVLALATREPTHASTRGESASTVNSSSAPALACWRKRGELIAAVTSDEELFSQEHCAWR
jgi:hypothetical protein